MCTTNFSMKKKKNNKFMLQVTHINKKRKTGEEKKNNFKGELFLVN